MEEKKGLMSKLFSLLSKIFKWKKKEPKKEEN